MLTRSSTSRSEVRRACPATGAAARWRELTWQACAMAVPERLADAVGGPYSVIPGASPISGASAPPRAAATQHAACVVVGVLRRQQTHLAMLGELGQPLVALPAEQRDVITQAEAFDGLRDAGAIGPIADDHETRVRDGASHQLECLDCLLDSSVGEQGADEQGSW